MTTASPAPATANGPDEPALARDSEEPAIGDVGALFDRYAPQLWRYCARRVGPDLAEDVVAEVFLVVARHPDRIATGESPRAWLYGIATNRLRAHRRSELRALKALERAGVDPVGGATGVAEGHEGRSAEPADAVTTAPAPPTTAELIEAWARDLEAGPPAPPAVPASSSGRHPGCSPAASGPTSRPAHHG